MSDSPTGSSEGERVPEYKDAAERTIEYVISLEATVEQLRLRNQTMREALADLLDWAERFRGGDPKLQSEDWYVSRDFARAALSEPAEPEEG